MAAPTLPIPTKSARCTSRGRRTRAKAISGSRSGCRDRQRSDSRRVPTGVVMAGLDLEGIETWARTELDRKNAAREQALRWSRELVRACANSIRAVHRREFSAAEELLGQAHAL